jgi:uncharacterized protein GlcG (DUF336 family)
MNQAQAEQALSAAKSKAQALGRKVSIVVVDSHGELVAALRLDGAPYVTAEMARGKAMVAAIFGRPSAAVASEPAAAASTHQKIDNWHGNRLVFAQGAVPVRVDGELIGAVGAGGAPGPDDEAISTAGAEAISPTA